MEAAADIIIKVGAVIGAICVIAGAILSVCSGYLKLKKICADINHMKKEDALVMSAICACLDGLIQLGANHKVPETKKKLDEYINEQAHQI